MQDLVHNDQQMVTAPLGISRHEFCHYRINFLNNVHLEELFKLDLARSYNGSDNFECRSIEFGMANLKVFE